jgi:hypothetical protein
MISRTPLICGWERKPHMSPSDVLLSRIRGEYREMPGLRLTFAQACRLWQVDAATCQVVLQTLVAEHFLVRTANGGFMAFPAAHRLRDIPLKAMTEPIEATVSRTRRSA